MIDLANLPNDVDALKAIIVADRSCIARLEVLVAAFKQAMFGRKSEKLNADQFEFALEDIETAIEAVKAESDASEFTSGPRTKKPRAANRGSLPKHLPSIEEIIEI